MAAMGGSDVVAVGEHRLLREEWGKLIVGPRQHFLGGAVEFRRTLIKFSVQMGFEFVFLKNSPTRVTAVCSYRVDKYCPWRIQAVEDLTDRSFCISSYERNVWECIWECVAEEDKSSHYI